MRLENEGDLRLGGEAAVAVSTGGDRVFGSFGFVDGLGEDGIVCVCYLRGAVDIRYGWIDRDNEEKQRSRGRLQTEFASDEI